MSQSLKRSQKTEFPVVRDHSFSKFIVKDQYKRKSHILNSNFRPAIEIYRPPKVRSDAGRLNVHAKEFTMHELQNSKSSDHLADHSSLPSLQHSKSSGSLLRHHHHHHVTQNVIPLIPLPMLHSHQVMNMPMKYSCFQDFPTRPIWQPSPTQTSLKRSKSLGSSEYHNSISVTNEIKGSLDLSIFAKELKETIQLAMDDTSQLSMRTTMDLVKGIVDQAIQGLKFVDTCAKVCVFIIKQSQAQTFLESLLNTCQQKYQERDYLLRGVKAGDGTRFTVFMWFLTELYAQLKRYQVTDDELEPDLVMLSLLSKCCETCVAQPIKCVVETECLFFVLTSIGKHLESELPKQLERLMAEVRDRFLETSPNSNIRRTLLQLIELHASNWQLAGSSVLYYYPKIK